MALFFDQDWFNARLKAAGKHQKDVAALLELNTDQVAEVWKDQRELMPQEVARLARFFGVTPAEVADHAGVSTPVPGALDTDEGADAAVLQKLDELNERMIRVERSIVDLKALILDLARKE